MKQLTEFPPILQRLVSDMSEEQLQQSLISEGVFRHCPAVTTTQIGINLAVSIAVDLRSFRDESVSLLRLSVADSSWPILIRNLDRRVVAASEGSTESFLQKLHQLGFQFEWRDQSLAGTLSPSQNSFTAFVKLAAARRYCWKLGCSTCGSWKYRSGLFLLSLGAVPESLRWKRMERHLELSPKSFQDPDIFDQEFCGLLRGADLREISQQCIFPDWLGYLGVVISEMQRCRSTATSEVLRSWALQLADMISFDPATCANIGRRGLIGERRLSWQDLEEVATALRRAGIERVSPESN